MRKEEQSITIIEIIISFLMVVIIIVSAYLSDDNVEQRIKTLENNSNNSTQKYKYMEPWHPTLKLKDLKKSD